MKPAPLTLHQPVTVDAVLDLLGEHNDTSKVMAGGQSLIPVLNLRLGAIDHLIALDDVSELSHVRDDPEGLHLGAMVRQSTAEHSELVARAAPLLSRALPLVAHHQIRNRGTVGGSIAHADPAAELPAVALVLDAVLEARSHDGTRTIAADEFFLGTWQTALREGELLTGMRVPRRAGQWGHAIDEVALRHGDFALAGIAVSLSVDDDARVEQARVAVFGLGPSPVRVHGVEQLLVGATPTGVAADAVEVLRHDVDVTGDEVAPADYKRHVAGVLLGRVLLQAHQEACRAGT